MLPKINSFFVFRAGITISGGIRLLGGVINNAIMIFSHASSIKNNAYNKYKEMRMRLRKSTALSMMLMMGMAVFAADVGKKTRKNRGGAARLLQKQAASVQAGKFKAGGSILYMPIGHHGEVIAGLLGSLKTPPDQTEKLWNQLFATTR